MFLKVSPTQAVHYFGIKGKLNPKFIEPFEILKRIDKVPYELALPPGLVHNVFHLSQLCKYISDPSHVLIHEQLQVDDGLAYKEKLIQIFKT